MPEGRAAGELALGWMREAGMQGLRTLMPFIENFNAVSA